MRNDYLDNMVCIEYFDYMDCNEYLINGQNSTNAQYHNVTQDHRWQFYYIFSNILLGEHGPPEMVTWCCCMFSDISFKYNPSDFSISALNHTGRRVMLEQQKSNMLCT